MVRREASASILARVLLLWRETMTMATLIKGNVSSGLAHSSDVFSISVMARRVGEQKSDRELEKVLRALCGQWEETVKH